MRLIIQGKIGRTRSVGQRRIFRLRNPRVWLFKRVGLESLPTKCKNQNDDIQAPMGDKYVRKRRKLLP